MTFEIIVELKKEVLDAQGRAIRESLKRLGHESLSDIKCSKRFVLELANTEKNPEQKAQEIAKEFLANPVSESFSVRKL